MMLQASSTPQGRHSSGHHHLRHLPSQTRPSRLQQAAPLSAPAVSFTQRQNDMVSSSYRPGPIHTRATSICSSGMTRNVRRRHVRIEYRGGVVRTGGGPCAGAGVRGRRDERGVHAHQVEDGCGRRHLRRTVTPLVVPPARWGGIYPRQLKWQRRCCWRRTAITHLR